MNFTKQSILKTNETFTEAKKWAETYGGGNFKAAIRELDERTKADDLFPAEYESYHARGSQATRHLKAASEMLTRCCPLELPGITLSRWMPVGDDAYSVFNLPAIAMIPSFARQHMEGRSFKLSQVLKRIHKTDIQRMDKTSWLFVRYLLGKYQWLTWGSLGTSIALYSVFSTAFPWYAFIVWATIFGVLSLVDSEDEKSSNFGFSHKLYEPVPDELREKIRAITISARKTLERKEVVVVFAEDVHTWEVHRAGKPAGFKLRVGEFPRSSTVAVLLCVGGKQDNPMPSLPEYYLIDSYSHTVTEDL